MIQAKELRIGNKLKWLHEDDESIVTVTIDDIQTIDTYNKYPESEEFARGLWYSPIPLTPDLLKKIGFRSVDELKHGRKYATKNGWLLRISDTHAIVIDFFIDGKIHIGVEHTSHLKFVWLGYTEYLHKLQNFYFTLTGTEFAITL